VDHECRNNGKCVNLIGRYNCRCFNNTYGRFCQWRAYKLMMCLVKLYNCAEDVYWFYWYNQCTHQFILDYLRILSFSPGLHVALIAMTRQLLSPSMQMWIIALNLWNWDHCYAGKHVHYTVKVLISRKQCKMQTLLLQSNWVTLRSFTELSKMWNFVFHTVMQQLIKISTTIMHASCSSCAKTIICLFAPIC